MNPPFRSIAIAPLLAFAGALSASGVSNDVTFYVPFDGSVSATRAAGSPVARIYGEEGYTEGVAGQAVVVGGKRRLAYAGAKNIPTAAGAICFWARPLDWTPTIDKFVFFVALLSQHGKRVARVMLYKPHNTSSLLVLAQSLDASVSRQLRSPAASWQTNEWRHFALTWNSQRIALYVNGNVVDALRDGVRRLDRAFDWRRVRRIGTHARTVGAVCSRPVRAFRFCTTHTRA